MNPPTLSRLYGRQSFIMGKLQSLDEQLRDLEVTKTRLEKLVKTNRADLDAVGGAIKEYHDKTE